MVTFYIIVGSLIAIPLINRFETRKWILAGLLYSNAVFQFTFYGIPNLNYLIVNRIFVGISQVSYWLMLFNINFISLLS